MFSFAGNAKSTFIPCFQNGLINFQIGGTPYPFISIDRLANICEFESKLKSTHVHCIHLENTDNFLIYFEVLLCLMRKWTKQLDVLTNANPHFTVKCYQWCLVK